MADGSDDSDRRGAPARWPIVALVIAVHAAILPSILVPTHPSRSDVDSLQPMSWIQLTVQPESWDKLPTPEVTLQNPHLEATLAQIRFDDPIEDELAGFTGSSSAPRLSRFQRVDVREYARRAHVQPGKPATVVLVVRVGEDGYANAVDIARSCGNSRVDAAAVDYALELHWIPGTQNHIPQAQRILLAVILSAS